MVVLWITGSSSPRTRELIKKNASTKFYVKNTLGVSDFLEDFLKLLKVDLRRLGRIIINRIITLTNNYFFIDVKKV
jgi:hypothetical protein